MRVVKIILGALLFGLGVAFIAMAAVNEVIDPAYFRSGFDVAFSIVFGSTFLLGGLLVIHTVRGPQPA
jgi:hypothetical protein